MSRIGRLRWLIGLTGILSVVYGVSRDEVPVVLHKAVNICLECIGIG